MSDVWHNYAFIALPCFSCHTYSAVQKPVESLGAHHGELRPSFDVWVALASLARRCLLASLDRSHSLLALLAHREEAVQLITVFMRTDSKTRFNALAV